MISEFVEIVLVSGLGALGYKIYIQGKQTSEVIDEFKDKANEGFQLLQDAKIIQPIDYSVDTSVLMTKIQSSGTLKVLNLSCQEKILINQTGSSDLPFLGILFPGEAHFEFSTRFTGSVEYKIEDLVIEQLDNILRVKVGTPIINLSDLKFTNTSDSGNLNKKLLAKTKAQEVLDRIDNYPYYLKLFFNGLDNGELVSNVINQDAFEQLEMHLKDLLTKTLSAAKQNLQYEIMIEPPLLNPDSVMIKLGEGKDHVITYDAINGSSIDSISQHFTNRDSPVQLLIEHLAGSIRPANSDNTVVLTN